jgi:cytochrome c peroxidase
VAPGRECEADLGLATADCDRVRAMRLPAALPPARGNRYAECESAARLGFRLFFNSDLGGGVSCATCHGPKSQFADPRPVSAGHGAGTRNAPTVFNAARLSVFFWDGRADALWSQPLFAIENPLEMASSRLALAHLVADTGLLRELYEATFGPLPDLSSLPRAGRPGDPAFDALAPAQRDAVDRIAANVGKAFEAYMRRNAAGPAPLDRYLAGDTAAINAVARQGLRLFVTARCIDCHGGPMLTDEGFHRVGFPSLSGAAHDPGRAGALAVLTANPFRLAGPFADLIPDAPPGFTPPPEPADADGAFRTPSLRYVTETRPYGHDGALASLDDVLAAHAADLGADQRRQLVALFQTLVGSRPPLPWSNWPAPQ